MADYIDGGGSRLPTASIGSDGRTVAASGVKPGSTVTLYRNGATAGTATADSAGVWSYVFGTAPAAGDLLAYDAVLSGPTTSVAPSALTITGAPGPATAGTAYAFTPTVGGGSGTRSFTLSGSLPAGLSFSATGGGITGTPTTAGTTSGLVITVTDASGSATLSGLSITVGATAAAYLGPVATLAIVPNQVTTSPQFMSRSRHKATQALSTATGMKLVLPNFFVKATGSGADDLEHGSGGTVTYKATIEYPSGTIVGTATFGGNPSGVASDGGTLVSDAISLSATIPSGGFFFVRMYGVGTAGFCYSNFLNANTLPDVANGEGLLYGTSVADTTGTGGSFTPTTNNPIVRPCAIIGQTSAASVALIGDSRESGLRDNHNSGETAGDLGECARALGAAGIAYINGGVPSDLALWWKQSHTNRLALANYCSHAIVNLGVNDIYPGNQTDAQVQASLNAIRGLLPSSMPVWLVTMAPEATSSDQYKTAANQTLSAVGQGNAARAANNAWRRTVPAGFAGCIDVAADVEDPANPGKWKTDGASTNLWTDDGIHQKRYANEFTRTNGTVPVASFTR